MKRRIVGIFLSFCMVLGCGEYKAYANTDDVLPDDTNEQITEEKDDVTYEEEQDIEYVATATDAMALKEESVVPVQANAVPNVNYTAHVAGIGWQSNVKDGAVAGTTNLAKSIEALRISVSGIEGLGIRYAAHGQGYGWQGWVSDGATAGTTGLSKRVEAIKIELTGEKADNYDIYYRAHVQNIGWLDWAKNGMTAGSYGFSLRLEALQVMIVEKNAPAPGKVGAACYCSSNVNYQVHEQDIGWMNTVSNGETGGVTGRSKRMEAIKISIPDLDGVGVKYRTHVQNIGWMNYVYDGELSGTSGQSKRVEAIKIELTGNNASNYNIWYRTHVQGIGWMNWVSNGAIAGTTGLSKRIEAIQIIVLPQGLKGPNGASATAPGATQASEASILARQKLNQIGWDLKSAFDYSAGLTYYRNVSVPPTGEHLNTYATYGFNNGKGNCYVMAATFCQMARELGYECYLVEGYVPKRGGGTTVHGWTEIVINGRVYVCDPDFTNETKKNGYMITYGTSGTWRYQDYSRVN